MKTWLMAMLLAMTAIGAGAQELPETAGVRALLAPQSATFHSVGLLRPLTLVVEQLQDTSYQGTIETFGEGGRTEWQSWQGEFIASQDVDVAGGEAIGTISATLKAVKQEVCTTVMCIFEPAVITRTPIGAIHLEFVSADELRLHHSYGDVTTFRTGSSLAVEQGVSEGPWIFQGAANGQVRAGLAHLVELQVEAYLPQYGDDYRLLAIECSDAACAEVRGAFNASESDHLVVLWKRAETVGKVLTLARRPAVMGRGAGWSIRGDAGRGVVMKNGAGFAVVATIGGTSLVTAQLSGVAPFSSAN